MAKLEIFYDSLQELLWFRSLDPRLATLSDREFPDRIPENSKLGIALAYDRPDVIVTSNELPVLVVERSEEVPSGHNVGQRFARLVAGARAGAVGLYMFPFVAKKHGGETAGPRYVNLRLFKALEKVEAFYQTPLLAINWRVDAHYEVIKTPAKDAEIRTVVSSFLTTHLGNGSLDEFTRSKDVAALRRAMSDFSGTIRRKHVYENPPDSLRILSTEDAARFLSIRPPDLPTTAEVLVYCIGMTYIRSDPYVGMGMLYDYLYARDSRTTRYRGVILHCPKISLTQWRSEAQKGTRNKTIRLFVELADIMVFSDGYLTRGGLLS